MVNTRSGFVSLQNQWPIFANSIQPSASELGEKSNSRSRCGFLRSIQRSELLRWNEIKALDVGVEPQTCGPDQCLPHRRSGLDLFVPGIDLSCFASGYLYNTFAVVWLSRGSADSFWCTNP